MSLIQLLMLHITCVCPSSIKNIIEKHKRIKKYYDLASNNIFRMKIKSKLICLLRNLICSFEVVVVTY